MAEQNKLGTRKHMGQPHPSSTRPRRSKLRLGHIMEKFMAEAQKMGERQRPSMDVDKDNSQNRSKTAAEAAGLRQHVARQVSGMSGLGEEAFPGIAESGPGPTS